MIYLYEITWGRAGKKKYESLLIVRAVYAPPAKCVYCHNVHETFREAYDCCTEYVMLELVTAEDDSDPEYVRIAKEKGHHYG